RVSVMSEVSSPRPTSVGRMWMHGALTGGTPPESRVVGWVRSVNFARPFLGLQEGCPQNLAGFADFWVRSACFRIRWVPAQPILDTGGEFGSPLVDRGKSLRKGPQLAQAPVRRSPTGIRHQCHSWVRSAYFRIRVVPARPILGFVRRV